MSSLAFEWEGDVPDPQAESTFLNSKLTADLYSEGKHNSPFHLLQGIDKDEKGDPGPFSSKQRGRLEVKGFEDQKVLTVRRRFKSDIIFCLFNFNDSLTSIGLPLPEGTWVKIFDSSSAKWGGNADIALEEIVSDGSEIPFNLAPYSFILYRMFKGES